MKQKDFWNSLAWVLHKRSAQYDRHCETCLSGEKNFGRWPSI